MSKNKSHNSQLHEENKSTNISVENLEDKENSIQNRILEGSIPKTIYLVAAPTMIHMFLETSYHFIDAIWIGMLGSVALAAVASASFVLWLIFSACTLVEVGVNSLVAKYSGANDKEAVNKISRNGFLFGIFLSFFIALIGILTAENTFYLLGLENDVIYNALCFMLPVFVGLPVFVTTIITSAIFRGIGDTKTPLKVLSLTLILNGLIAPLFIFGIVFTQMGIAGGALATILCQSLASIVNVTILKKRKVINNESFFDLNSFKEIAKIGSPIAVNGVIFCIVYLFLTRVISQYGTEPVAALGIGHRVESLGYCISVGFSIAATTLVGQNIGAKNYKRAKEIAWKIASYIGVLMMFISINILLFKDKIARVFTQDPEVIANASGYLTAIGYTETFLGFEIVMEGVFSGLGNTLPPTIIGLPLNILRVPVAYFMAKYYGIDAIWWTIGITTMLKGIILLIWFRYISADKKLTESTV